MMVNGGREKPKLVVNIEISKDGDFCERVEGQNVLHFGAVMDVMILLKADNRLPAKVFECSGKKRLLLLLVVLGPRRSL
ncbi:hypothetical protein E2C01_030830 [Portunus trituberculatus]|uniref:Uncharacterized protein n=1 Tax=Portunus trituberculatus TaxID=210409 RepID=A0A5B7EVY6_PORTR|nr:hypothetical protein [Portunus trituberculatus]